MLIPVLVKNSRSGQKGYNITKNKQTNIRQNRKQGTYLCTDWSFVNRLRHCLGHLTVLNRHECETWPFS